MGIESFAVVSGPESVNMAANAGLANSAVRTGGRVAAELSAESKIESGVTIDKYKYRQFEAKAHTHHHVELRDKDGRLKWAEDFENLLTTEGLNTLLDSTFKAGSVSPEWYVGLVDGAEEPVYAASDTMNSHPGWIENLLYEEQVRQNYVPGDIAGGTVDNSSERAVFTINAEGKIAGCFIVFDPAKEGITGPLYGEGGFTGGVRDVETGDTLRVTSVLSVTD